MMDATAKKLEHRFLPLTTTFDSFRSLSPVRPTNLLFHLVGTYAWSTLLCSLIPSAPPGSPSLLTHTGSYDPSFQIHSWQHFFIHHPLDHLPHLSHQWPILTSIFSTLALRLPNAVREDHITELSVSITNFIFNLSWPLNSVQQSFYLMLINNFSHFP